jgi:hypothetical protein
MKQIDGLNSKVTDNWSTGFTNYITFTNKGDNLNGWTLEFDAPYQIYEIWGGKIVSQQGNHYVVSNDDSNKNVGYDQQVSIGFNADTNNGTLANPTNYSLDGISIQPLANSGIETPDSKGESISTSNNSNNTMTNPNPINGASTPTNPISQNPTPQPQNPNNSSQFKYGEALQKSYLFYEAQRSGDLPDNNRIEWRKDTGLNHGSDIGRDLSGGYYDAGDHMKFGLPMAYSMTMLSWGVNQYNDAYQKSGQLDEALSAIKWGTDYFLKGIVTDEAGVKEFYGQVGNSTALKEYWGSHENLTIPSPSYKIDRQRPGSDLAAETAASLASAAMVFRSSDPGYADNLLKNARLLYDFAEKYQGKYSDAIGPTERKDSYQSYSGYMDELSWGAAWLHKATGDSSYLSKAENYYQQDVGIGNLRPDWTIDWDDKTYGAALLLAQSSSNPGYKADVERWLNAWTDKSGNSGIKYTQGGLAWVTKWGSLSYTADTAMLAGIYSDTVNDGGGKYRSFAQDQVNYVLGNNPKNFSYMVGFGNNYALQPHHQTAQGRDGFDNFNSPEPNNNVLYGALVGGPESANDHDYKDDRTNYVSNEVALNYNAGLTGALAYMYDKFGGEALSDNELNSLPGIAVANM